jgi:hypothetical protein
VRTGVGVENLKISDNPVQIWDRKCLGYSDKSFVGHPGAIYFLRIFAKRGFQQSQAKARIEVELN